MTHPVVHKLHGIERIDDHAWMRDPEAVRDVLISERRRYESRIAHTAPFRQHLAAIMAGRTPETESSVSWRHGAFVYYTRIDTGREFGEFRRKRDGSDQTLLDLDTFGDYVELGVREVSPDDRWLAYSVDVTGDEVYELRFRDLSTMTDLPVRIPRTYYTGGWADGWFYYTVVDEVYRPWEVRRYDIATGVDELVLREGDRRFELTVRATRSGTHLLITAANRDTTEVWSVVDGVPESVGGRRAGIEYRCDATLDGLVTWTDDGHSEFRVVGVPPLPGERIHAVDCFDGYKVLTLRRGGDPLLRVLGDDGTSYEVHPPVPCGRISLVHNHEYLTETVTFETGSYSEPTQWWSLNLATGAQELLKENPRFDGYVSERIWAPAPDGAVIPITVVRRRDVPLNGTAPCLLYGYGAYEHVFDPVWDAALSAFLDEGAIFAHAGVRGGGEMGRAWWQAGRLDHKATTFTDHIAAAEHLLAGRVSRIATRGLSAGGLLQAAVYGMRPDLWAAVVAEVPFVDVVTTMLDDTIPLTVNEWDEWGDPRRPEDFTWMLAYSPYDNIPSGDLPPLLVTGAVNDPRVLVHEPAKWVAALRERGADVLFRVEVADGGHSGPPGRYAHLDYEAEIFAFVLEALKKT
ncbi:prolyl oligopeptidase family serine peptidase [Herbidospora cretacea]|uniref:prolyl oligopeptidase family serine peptidase n=1 Tax=Herbidospora cretacea TaxID=28444 RepID=UPI0009EE1B33|nr:prolyl oligopeptidase family serine peptidase [Herbidospora cretacea]